MASSTFHISGAEPGKKFSYKVGGPSAMVEADVELEICKPGTIPTVGPFDITITIKKLISGVAWDPV